MSKARVDAFLVIFVLFLFQNMLTYTFRPFVPPILLIGVIFYALYEGPIFGLFIGLWAGFFLDLFGTGPLGLEMAIFSAIGVTAALSASKFFRESAATKIFLPVAGEYFCIAMNFVFYKFSLGRYFVASDPWREALLIPHLLLTAFSAPFIFAWLKRISYPQEKRRSAAFIMRN